MNKRAPTGVWDLYCGVGGFALHAAAAGRQVVGVESTAEAIAAARAANPALDWVCADATSFLAAARAEQADCVIIDHPAKKRYWSTALSQNRP